MKGMSLFLLSMILLVGFAGFAFAQEDNVTVTLDNETVVLTNETLDVNETELINETVEINVTLSDENETGGADVVVDAGEEVVDYVDLELDLEIEDDIVKDKNSTFDRAVSYFEDLVNRINGISKNLFYILLIAFGVLGLLIYSIFFDSSSAEACFSKASSLHRKGEKAHVNGDHEKAKRLYDKSYSFREKGEEIASGGD